MKNNLNLVLAVMIFVVLGCSCPNLKDLTSVGKPDSSNGRNEPSSAANSAAKPEKEKSEVSSGLSLARYNQIKNGMTYMQVSAILGGEGTEVSSSSSGKFKTITYKWQGEKFDFVVATFQNEKLMFKSQGGLK